MWLDTQSSSGSKSPILSSVHQLTSSAHCHKHIISQCSAIWKLPKLPNSGMVSEGIGGGDIQEQREVREGGRGEGGEEPKGCCRIKKPIAELPKGRWTSLEVLLVDVHCTKIPWQSILALQQSRCSRKLRTRLSVSWSVINEAEANQQKLNIDLGSSLPTRESKDLQSGFSDLEALMRTFFNIFHYGTYNLKNERAGNKQNVIT